MNLNETTTLSSSINSAPPSPSPSPSTTTRKRRIADVLTPCLIETSVSIVLGTAGYFGYHLGVINAPIDVVISHFENRSCRAVVVASASASIFGTHLRCVRGENLYALGFALFAVGGFVGSIVAGFPADTIGRKWTLVLNNVFAVAGALMMALSSSFWLFLAGRFVSGFASGIGITVGQVYLSEISPASIRGLVGTFFELGVVGFIFLSEILGIPEVLGTRENDGWRYLFGLTVVLSGAQLFSLPFFPRSPRHLYLHQNEKRKAADALRRLHGANNVASALVELQTEKETATEAKVTLADFFRLPHLRYPLLVNFGIRFARQISGVNAVVFYSTKLFEESGLASPAIVTILVGVFLILLTVLVAWKVDSIGRRSLLLYGFGIIMISNMCVTIGLCFKVGFYSDHKVGSGITLPDILTIASSLLLSAGFAIGPGPVSWISGSEVFNQGPRVRAVGLIELANWVSIGAMGYAFPSFFDFFYPYGMIVLAGVAGIAWIFVYVYMFETKGKSVNEITKKIRDRANGRVSR
ncbi:solute carrier family 2, facilitated glucose transporter member 3-like [Oscarella lobularis]|uniref:solute carrier family 2, facilitated glucose transporter member 3-like n=1 Tax=Oscarella lobularis TaxID=121494 RepID=UPI0033132D51